MQIPFGYEFCKILFPGQNALIFKFDSHQGMFRKEIEIYDYFINILGNKHKTVIGYHLEFELTLLDINYSSQQNINLFYYYYNRNIELDKSFQIYSVYSFDLENKRWKDVNLFTVLLKEKNLKYVVIKLEITTTCGVVKKIHILEAKMNIAKIGKKIQVQIHQFSGKLSGRLPKIARRFIEEMVYGIQTRGSVRLSEVARSLNEKIGLNKTINRLLQQLKRPGLLD